MNEFFLQNKEFIDGVSALASVVSLIFSAIAVTFTAVVLIRTSKTNRARTIYEIHRDGRESARLLLADQKIAKDLLSRDMTHGDRVIAAVGQLFNYYSAVYHQWNLGTLDDKLWRSFEKELTGLLGSDRGRQFWEAKRDAGEYDDDLTALVNRIVDEQARARDTGTLTAQR